MLLTHMRCGGRPLARMPSVWAVQVFPRSGVIHTPPLETARFVPAIKDERRIPAEGRVVVNRTRDGGRTFDTLHRGLPQAWAYDLVYRHALDLDATGERLAFGSTTGSVWISEDSGDTPKPQQPPPRFAAARKQMAHSAKTFRRR